MAPGKRWTVTDRDKNRIYLSEERWLHIVDSNNHPEMVPFEEYLKLAIQRAKRQQEPLNPRKYRYSLHFDDLPAGFNHIVAIVVFGFDVDIHGVTVANNYVATAFMKHILPKNR
ncbi:MAG: hypothetical protein U0175_18415 [Caldilineaceae bacterium]